MVRSVTSFGRSGTSDWLIQRVSGVILLAYFVWLAAVLAGGVDYASWQAMFEGTAVRIFTLLALLSLASHAWIGLWAVSTDYMTERMMGPKGNVLRVAFQLTCSLVIFVYVIWGVQILWG